MTEHEFIDKYRFTQEVIHKEVVADLLREWGNLKEREHQEKIREIKEEFKDAALRISKGREDGIAIIQIDQALSILNRYLDDKK